MSNTSITCGGMVRYAALLCALVLAGYSYSAVAEKIQVKIVPLNDPSRPDELFEFKPAEVPAKPGDVVEWVNETSATHTATPDAPFKRLSIPGGSSKDSTLEATPGEVKYHCEIHDYMRGVIKVTAP